MRALVVYESMYGNTAMVGEAIADSLRAGGMDVNAGPVSNVSAAETAGADLLVVGGPTHVHGMSRASTRKVGAEDPKNLFAEPTVLPGLREWLETLPAGADRSATAFDTRLHKAVLLTGSAAKGIVHRLERAGFRMISDPESFFVTAENTLEDGEIEHAATWATDVAARALVRDPSLR